jgi:hypothetical protein
MLTHEWLKQARENEAVLVSLVAAYHPANIRPRKNKEKVPAYITAPNAERACEVIRKEIRKEFLGIPEEQLKAAIAEGKVDKVTELLNQAWFGVPESIGCWGVEGFREAVALLEDTPDDIVDMPDEDDAA